MDQSAPGSALSFRKRLFGYDPIEVETYLAKAVETHEAVRAEVERLRVAEPLARVGGDVATLLTTFAETVSSMREQAAGEIDRTKLEATDYAERQRADADVYASRQRAEADEYVARQHAEADRVLAEAVDRARDEERAMLAEARQELASVANRWSAIERALNEAAGGVAAALASVRRFEGFSADMIDIADHGGAPRGTEKPRDDELRSSTQSEDDDGDGTTVLPSLAAKMWRSRQERPAASGSRLQYLLPPSRGDRPGA